MQKHLNSARCSADDLVSWWRGWGVGRASAIGAVDRYVVAPIG